MIMILSWYLIVWSYSIPGSVFNEVTKEFIISKCPDGENPCNVSSSFYQSSGPSQSCTKITVEKGVHIIKSNAFFNIGPLKEVSLSSSIRKIELPFCRWCGNLEIITVSSDNDFFQTLGNCLYEYGFKSLVRAAPNHGSIDLSSKLQYILSQSFGVCGYSSLLIPKSVISIESGSFYDASVKEIIFEEGSLITSLGESSLSIIPGLLRLYLPPSLITLGSSSIASCGKLVEVDFGENSNIETIMANVFLNDFSLSKIILPPKLKTIGNNAFGYCDSITNLNFSSTVEQISLSAFSGCSQISTIIVQEGNEFYSVENGVLFNKKKDSVILIPKNIETFPIPDTLLSIGKTALQLCPNLTLLLINETHPKYAKHTQLLIDNATNTLVAVVGGIEELVIPDYVTILGDSCANQLSKINSITIGSNIKTIGSSAFKSSSISSLTINGTQVTISASAFEDCTLLSDVHFPQNGKINLGSNAFKYCTNLGDVIFNCEVTHLSSHAFSYSGVSSLKFNGGSFTEVGIYALYLTQKLSTVQFPSTVKTISTSSFEGSKINNITFLGGNYVKIVHSNAFTSCSSLISIDKFLAIESIGIRAFEGCLNLKEIEFADDCPISALSATNLFVNCKKITKIQLSKNIFVIEPSIFSGCSLLTEILASENSTSLITKSGILFSKNGELIVCPPGRSEANVNLNVTALNTRCFYGCSKLINLIFPDISSFKSISTNAFFGCTLLDYIRIPNSVENISGDSFIGCSSISKIEFGLNSKLKMVGDSTFSYCLNLENINLEYCSDLLFISGNCFDSCSKIKKVHLNPSMESIGSYAFKNCSNLKSIIFGNNSKLNYIKEGAFYNCSKLKYIELPNMLEFIDSKAFAKCSIEGTLSIPLGIINIGSDCFSGPLMKIDHVIYCGNKTLPVSIFGSQHPVIHVPKNFPHSTCFKLVVSRSLDNNCSITTMEYENPCTLSAQLLCSVVLSEEQNFNK